MTPKLVSLSQVKSVLHIRDMIMAWDFSFSCSKNLDILNVISTSLGDARSDVDFTDMIWSAMAGELTSYSELCNSLYLILNIIKKDEIRYLFMNTRL